MGTISEKFTYANDTTLTCPLVSFSLDHRHTVGSISLGIDDEMKKVIGWSAVNQLSHNVSETPYNRHPIARPWICCDSKI